MGEVKQEILSIIYKIKPELKTIPSDFLFNYSLTDPQIGFDSIEMVYLFIEISKSFSIQPNEEMVNDYYFNKLSNIISIIEDGMDEPQ